jgi:hypothetical protein
VADTIGTVRVELTADPTGIAEGIEQASATLTRVSAIGTTIGNLLSSALFRLGDAISSTISGLIDGTSELTDRIAGPTQNAVTLLSNSFNRLSDIGQTALAGVLDRVLPGVARLASEFARSEAVMMLVKSGAEALVFTLKVLLTAAAAAWAGFQILAETLRAIAGAVSAALVGDWAGAEVAISAGISNVVATAGRAGELIKNIWRETAVTAGEAGERLNQNAEISAGAFRRLQAEGRRVFEATRTPVEALAERLRRLNVLLDAGVINWDTYQRAVARAKDVVSHVQDTMRDVAGAFEQAFVGIVTGSKSAKDALKDLLGQLAQIFARAAFRNILFSIFGDDPAFAGMFGGGLFKNANGGLYRVGGVGGTDSKIVAAMATPGEYVQFSNEDPRQAGGGMMQPRVVVNNYSPHNVAASRTSDEDLEVTVRGIVRDEMGSGRMNPVMSHKYGLRPRVRSR